MMMHRCHPARRSRRIIAVDTADMFVIEDDDVLDGFVAAKPVQ
jgi:hypothetical protein